MEKFIPGDGTWYDSEATQSEETYAYAKWAYICEKSGHPLSASNSLINIQNSDTIAMVTIVGLVVVAFADAIIYIRNPKLVRLTNN